MAVELTSPVLGKEVGEAYTGPEEAWLLAEGYAKRASYTGPGVSNTGPTDVEPDEDPGLAANREAGYFPATADANTTIANDAENLTKVKFPLAAYDFDEGGVDDEEEPEPDPEPEPEPDPEGP